MVFIHGFVVSGNVRTHTKSNYVQRSICYKLVRWRPEFQTGIKSFRWDKEFSWTQHIGLASRTYVFVMGQASTRRALHGMYLLKILRLCSRKLRPERRVSPSSRLKPKDPADSETSRHLLPPPPTPQYTINKFSKKPQVSQKCS